MEEITSHFAKDFPLEEQNHKYFYLMHQNNIAAKMLIDTEDARIVRYEEINREIMPGSGLFDRILLNKWWRDRAIPKGRDHLSALLRHLDSKSPAELLIKNLGLSLNDTYWIKPPSLKISWDEINLFDHGERQIVFHDGLQRVHYSTSPDAAITGSLPKRSVKEGGDWYLEKAAGKEFLDGQQNVNEAFASMLHSRQNFKEYVDYSLHFRDGVADYCRCKLFTDKRHELISAYYVTGGREKNTDPRELLDRYIERCVRFGLDEGYCRDFIDYQILTDFVLTNTDRHWSNFGILRDPDTLRFVSMAPIYDTGSSMFYNNAYNQNRLTLLKTQTYGICERESDTLKLVSDKNIVQADLLPTPEETKEFFAENGIDEGKARVIAGNYSKKLDLLLELQHGIQVSYSHEVSHLLSSAFENQQINPDHFANYPDDKADMIEKPAGQNNTKKAVDLGWEPADGPISDSWWDTD